MANFQPHGMSRRPMREVRDTRKPLYIIFILDDSASMYETHTIADNEGVTREVKKIDELNEGLAAALDSLRRFEATNVLYKIFYQIIELNSYGKALFPDFVPLSLQAEEVGFEARGVTCLENSISTLKTFLDPKHMPGCNRAVNVILMSDGYPTDVEGYVVEEAVYRREIDSFKKYLEDRKLKPNVDLYSIGVGDDACEDMLKWFADPDKYYKVEALESLASKLDFVTRKSLVRLTTRVVRAPEGTDEEAEQASAAVAPSSPAETTASMAPSDVREVDAALCLGNTCLACMETCATSAIQYENGMVYITPAQCIGCGVCETRCPVDAIRVTDGVGCDDLI